MNREEHLLTCLAEECAEVAQRVSKALRFGLAEVQPGQPHNNAERIRDELCDLVAVAFILEREGLIPHTGMGRTTADSKLEKIEHFMVISRERGVLQ